ncbi:hypothetical protein V1512DRAFT_267961 [Lipomyces arxii]|uniref:uncharacterized protein n=1 Tax=Lipomyces arxii TaxID=56418 RepID=UPI0034D00FD6
MSTDQAQAADFQHRIDDLTEENRRVFEIIDKKNKEIASLHEEFDEVQTKYRDSRKIIVELQSKLQEAETEKLSSKFREQNLSQEIELLTTNNTWLDGELNAKAAEFSKFRREKSAQISKLQTELDSALSSVTSLTNSNEALNGRVGTLSKNYEDALLKIKNLQDANAAAEENFQKEMATQQRLAELWERSTNEARSRITELEDQLEAAQANELQHAASWKTLAEKESERATQAETKLAAVETQLKELHAEQEQNQEQQDLDNPFSAPSTPVGNKTSLTLLQSPMGLFSPSARAISQVQKSGISLTQLYTDFMKTKRQLEHERQRNKSLQQNFDELINDLETRAPIIQAEREEANRLKIEIADMSMLLDETERDKEDTEKQLSAILVKSNDAEREAKIYRQQVHDLSRQVQTLLVELQFHISGASQLSAADQTALRRLIAETSGDATESDTDTLISERLVTFKNTIELQQQNQNLLRVTRDLGDRLEREEVAAKKNIDVLKATALAETEKTILELQAKLQHAQNKMESYQRERDMFRDMLSVNGQSGAQLDLLPLQSTGAEESRNTVSLEKYDEIVEKLEEATTAMQDLQDQYEAYRKEAADDIKTLNEQIAHASDERFAIQREFSRAQTQVELTSERLKIMTDNFELAKKDRDEIQKRSNQIQENLTRQDLRTQQVANELLELKTSLESMRAENGAFRAEKSVYTATQHRLLQDNKELVEEKQRLNNLIGYFQNVNTEREKSDGEARRRLAAQVESLETELKAARETIASENEEMKRLVLRKDYEIKELQEKIEKASESFLATKEELSTATRNKEQLQALVDELNSKLSVSEEKAAMYQRQTEEEGFSVVRSLESEITNTKSALEQARTELEGAKEQIEIVTGISKSAEEALASLTATHDHYKSSIEEQLKTKEQDIDNLNIQVANLSKELAETTSELSKAQEATVAADRAAVDVQNSLKKELEHVKANEERLMTGIRVVQTDLKKQAQITHESQQNYETELMKHASTAQELQKLRDANSQTDNLINELRQDAERARKEFDTSQTAWDIRKQEYEEEIASFRSRCDQLSDQNKLLHRQFEVLSSQVTRIQEQRRQDPSVPEGQADAVGTPGSAMPVTPSRVAAVTSYGDDSTVEDLREIIKFLRHEKEIVDCQYELSLQEAKRLRQRLEYTSASLDEVRIQLVQERETNLSADEQSQMHNQLVEKVNEINILRESNSSLREETKRMSGQLSDLEDKIRSLTDQIEPLENKLSIATADLEAKEQQLTLTQEDNERWKARTQHILQKYERVDPVELQNLKEDVTTLKAQVESLQSERDAIKAEKDIIQTESESSVEKLKADLESLQARFDRLKNEANAKIKNNRDARDAARAEIVTLMQTIRERDQSIADAKTASEALQQKIVELQARITELDSEVIGLKTEITSFKSEVTKLQTEIADAKSIINAKDMEIEVMRTESAAAIADAKASASGKTDLGLNANTSDSDEQQRKLQELQQNLERTQEELKQAIETNSESATELQKLREELEKRQAEIKSAEGSSTDPANGEPAGSSEDVEKLKSELEAKYKSDLEEALKAKDAEMEHIRVEAISKTRESVTRESSMRSTLLQHKADKLEREKQEIQKQLDFLRVQSNVSSSAPMASQGTIASKTSSSAIAGVASSAPALPVPQQAAQQLIQRPQATMKADAPAFVPTVANKEVLQTAFSLDPVKTSSNSGEATAPVTSIPVRTLGGRSAMANQGLAKSGSQLPQPTRPHLQYARNPANPILQHLQVGQRRGPAVMRPNAEGHAEVGSNIPRPAPTNIDVITTTASQQANTISTASTASTDHIPVANASGNAGAKRAREDEVNVGGNASSGDGATAGDEQTEVPAGPPIILKRRREETQ